jgi:hypothetical protein
MKEVRKLYFDVYFNSFRYCKNLTFVHPLRKNVVLVPFLPPRTTQFELKLQIASELEIVRLGKEVRSLSQTVPLLLPVPLALATVLPGQSGLLSHRFF